MMTRPEFEDCLLRVAHAWRGVGFLHNGRTKSQGVDCLGLIVCIFREVGIIVPDGDGKTYSTDWYLHTPEERYLSALLAYGTPVDKNELLMGDVPYFRPGVLAPAKSPAITHGGIYLGEGTFIHSINGRGVDIGVLSHRAWVVSYAGASRPLAVSAALGDT